MRAVADVDFMLDPLPGATLHDVLRRAREEAAVVPVTALGRPAYLLTRYSTLREYFAAQDEFLTLGADTITCRDSRGRVLWKRDNFPSANVVDVRDFVSGQAIKSDLYARGKTSRPCLSRKTRRLLASSKLSVPSAFL